MYTYIFVHDVIAAQCAQLPAPLSSFAPSHLVPAKASEHRCIASRLVCANSCSFLVMALMLTGDASLRGQVGGWDGPICYIVLHARVHAYREGGRMQKAARAADWPRGSEGCDSAESVAGQ